MPEKRYQKDFQNAPFGHRLGTLAPLFRYVWRSFCEEFSKRVLGDPFDGKGAEKKHPQGGRHAIRTRLRMFYEGRPVRHNIIPEAPSGANFGSQIHNIGEKVSCLGVIFFRNLFFS